MPSPTLSRSQTFHETNHRVGFWLDSLVNAFGQAGVHSHEPIARLLAELSRAGAQLRARPLSSPGADPELDRELDLYRGHVERLRALMPSIHSHLLAERARIESQRAQVRIAADWARASRQTL
jgi:hypothetical protein